MLEIRNVIVKSHSWQERRLFWLYSRQNIWTQWRSWYMAWQNISIRLRWMAYFSLGPHMTLKLYGVIKQCFYFSRTGFSLSFCLPPSPLLRALMLCHHNVGLWVIHTKAHIVDHHATHFRFMFQFCARGCACACFCKQADICHKKGKTLSRAFLS